MVCTMVRRDTDIIWHKIYLKLRSLHLLNQNSIEQEPLKLLPLFGSPKSENYYLMSQMRDIFNFPNQRYKGGHFWVEFLGFCHSAVSNGTFWCSHSHHNELNLPFHLGSSCTKMFWQMRRRKAIIRDIAALGQPRIGRPLETKASRFDIC